MLFLVKQKTEKAKSCKKRCFFHSPLVRKCWKDQKFRKTWIFSLLYPSKKKERRPKVSKFSLLFPRQKKRKRLKVAKNFVFFTLLSLESGGKTKGFTKRVFFHSSSPSKKKQKSPKVAKNVAVFTIPSSESGGKAQSFKKRAPEMRIAQVFHFFLARFLEWAERKHGRLVEGRHFPFIFQKTLLSKWQNGWKIGWGLQNVSTLTFSGFRKCDYNNVLSDS